MINKVEQKIKKRLLMIIFTQMKMRSIYQKILNKQTKTNKKSI